MVYNKNLKIIAFVGMAGSGKSTAAEYLAQKGFPKIYSGGILHEEMRRREIEIIPENQYAFSSKIRSEQGEEIIAVLCATQIHNLVEAGQKHIVLDGPYSWPEFRYLKSEFPGSITVIGIVAPRKLRHRRLTKRLKRPLTEQQSTERDRFEIEDLGKGGSIAVADHYIISDGSIESFYKSIDEIVDKLDFHKP